MESAAAGLGAMGFWIFIAACVLGGIWDAARKRESQQETLRRLVESGRDINPELVEQVINASGGGDTVARDLKVAGLIVIFIAPGLLVMGLLLGQIAENAVLPLLGAASITGFLGMGLLLASKVAARHDAKGGDKAA